MKNPSVPLDADLKTVYHYSNQKWDRPDIKKIISKRTNHDNGNLGLWCATSNAEWAKGFGRYTYELDIGMNACKDITVDELRNIAPDADYLKVRNQLIRDGYKVLRIIEVDDRCEMLVMLDLNNWNNIRVKDNK